VAGFVLQPISHHLRAQQVQFTRLPFESPRLSSAAGGDEATLTLRESQRIEHFLARVFPTRAMKRLERTADRPATRRATYAAITQEGTRFVVVGFAARWKESANVLAVYRLEDGGPNQVWRSKPWEASYYGVHIASAKAGARNVVLFEEGGLPGEYGLASVFSFQNEKNGLIMHDLTPSLPWLLARTHFPFRPLYGQDISLTVDNDGKSILLSASDEAYKISGPASYRPVQTWKFNRSRDRFERIRVGKPAGSALTHRE
jgi:hypothetical protein